MQTTNDNQNRVIAESWKLDLDSLPRLAKVEVPQTYQELNAKYEKKTKNSNN